MRTTPRAVFAIALSLLGCRARSTHNAPAPERPREDVCGELKPHDVVSDARFTYAYVRAAWETTGRAWLATYGGVRYETAARWSVESAWKKAPGDVAQSAYDLEYALRPAIQMADARRDVPLLDEIAGFLVAYEARFTMVGALRAQTQYDTSLLKESGSDDKKTLEWIDGKRIRECTLCNGQFYHPIARLLRAVASLPTECRTSSMREASAFYSHLLTNDWLSWELHGAGLQRTANWKAIADHETSGKWPGPIFSDNDAWVLGAAAEILGAHSIDPSVVPLTQEEVARLRKDVALGVRAMQTYLKIHPDTKNAKGEKVGSASYFDGMFADHPDMAYAGYTGETFPTAADAARDPNVGWDVSHFYRFPVLLRSLRDLRSATGVSEPTDHDIELLANQRLFVVFRGDSKKPLFNNFFNGGNGWYRVGYGGEPDAGYSPVQYCDAREKIGGHAYRCDFVFAGLAGWGLLAPYSRELARMQIALLDLAWSTDPEIVEFKDRYYFYDKSTFSPVDSKGHPQYPFMLLTLMGEIADTLR